MEHVLDVDCHHMIHSCLVSFDIVDDVIGLIQLFAKQERIVIFIQNERDKSINHVFLYDPSCDVWRPHLYDDTFADLQYPHIHMKNDHTVMGFEQEDYDATLFNIIEYDINNKTITRKLVRTNEQQLQQQQQNFSEWIDLNSWNVKTKRYYFYNMITQQAEEMVNQRENDLSPTRFIYSARMKHGLGKLFGSFEQKTAQDLNYFHEYTIHHQWQVKSTPLFYIDYRSIDVVYKGKIYICGGINHNQCQEYDMQSDKWTSQ